MESTGHRGRDREDEDPGQLLDRARRARDEDLRWELVTAAHADGSRRCFDVAVALCGSDLPADRCLAADVLGQLGTPLMPWRSRSIEPLRALLQDPNHDVTRSAAVALGHLRAGMAIDDLIAIRQHPNPEVRHAVAFALMSHRDPRTVDALVELSRDDSALVRDWATFALATQIDIDRPAVRDALAERLQDPDEATRAEAVVGLATRRDPRAAAPLCEQLGRPEPACVMVDAARSMACRDVLPALLSLRERGWTDGQTEPRLLEEAITACREGVGRLP